MCIWQVATDLDYVEIMDVLKMYMSPRNVTCRNYITWSLQAVPYFDSCLFSDYTCVSCI